MCNMQANGSIPPLWGRVRRGFPVPRRNDVCYTRKRILPSSSRIQYRRTSVFREQNAYLNAGAVILCSAECQHFQHYNIGTGSRYDWESTFDTRG